VYKTGDLAHYDEKGNIFYDGRTDYQIKHMGYRIELGEIETAMNSIKDMIDVNTIIGDPIETSNGMVIIPISKVCFGFAAGGSEFKGETIDEYKKRDKEEEVQYRLPFGGGSGAGDPSESGGFPADFFSSSLWQDREFC